MKKVFVTIVCLFLLLIACSPSTTVTAPQPTVAIPTPTTAPVLTATTIPLPTVTSAGYQWGVQIKTSGCVANQVLQDAACTPGDIFPKATKAIVCVPGYAQSVRDVSVSEKNAVYAAYGISNHMPGQYEVDHLVALELGGNNAISNLWPEGEVPLPGYHQKDILENALHADVCSGKISLYQAQVAIAKNWVKAWLALPPALREQ